MSTIEHHRPHHMRTLAVLSLAGLAYALAQTTVVPALPELMRGLHTDESGVTWTVTAYLIAAAVFTPLLGRLGDIYGKRRLLVVALLVFAAGSLVAAVSSPMPAGQLCRARPSAAASMLVGARRVVA